MAEANNSESFSSPKAATSSINEETEEIPFVTRWQNSDVIFLVEGKELHVHRLILVMQSKVFEAMLDGHFKEARQERIELPEKHYYDMLAFLKIYLYPTSMFEFSEDDLMLEINVNILQIISLADEYQAINLVNQLLRQIWNQNLITPNNVLKILDFARKYDNTYCIEKCVKMAQTYVKTKVLKDNIPQLSSDVIQEILLKKCEILENIVQRGHAFLESAVIANDTKVNGHGGSTDEYSKRCPKGHTIKVTQFRRARECPGCLLLYDQEFCRSFSYEYFEWSDGVPLVKLLESMDEVVQ